MNEKGMAKMVKIRVAPGVVQCWLNGVEVSNLVEVEVAGSQITFPTVKLTIMPDELEIEGEIAVVQMGELTDEEEE